MRVSTPGAGSIVKKPSAFDERHVPDLILTRDTQIREITHCLTPLVSKRRPTHLWLYGPVGSGKTVTARHVLEQLQREHGILGVYVNCWEHNSLYFVLSRILDELRVLHTDVRDTAFKKERLFRYLKNEPLLVILDEIDKPSPQERNAILYNLSTLDRLGLLCICNSRYALHLAEDRVRSRIAPVQVKFGAYSSEELQAILKVRRDDGLAEGAVDPSLLDRIADLSFGDARVAIQMLGRAGQVAEQESASKVQFWHVQKARARGLGRRKSYLLQDLTEDHRMIYDTVSEKGEVLTGQLFAEYRKRCHKLGRKPIAIRTFSNYVNALANAKLITSERARVPGKVRLLKVA
jgi:orc1/cdc6 family replication initiation protein